jgi:hypothetical protein
MPTADRCIISAIGMLLKTIFKGNQLKQETPPFFVLYYVQQLHVAYKIVAE